MEYRKPEVSDYGSVVDHTYQTPGQGTKSNNPAYEQDKFGEYSHPAAT